MPRQDLQSTPTDQLERRLRIINGIIASADCSSCKRNTYQREIRRIEAVLAQRAAAGQPRTPTVEWNESNPLPEPPPG